MKIEDILNIAVKVIRQVKEPQRIVLFGSRARGDAQETSDIDLAIFGRHWTDQDLNQAKNLLEEGVRTPLKFDVVLFDTLDNPKLKRNIETTGRRLYESGTDQGTVC